MPLLLHRLHDLLEFMSHNEVLKIVLLRELLRNDKIYYLTSVAIIDIYICPTIRACRCELIGFPSVLVADALHKTYVGSTADGERVQQ